MIKALIFVFAAAWITACGGGGDEFSDCDQGKGLVVTVSSFATSAICDAVVEATDGSYNSQLKPNGTGASCFYKLGPRAGNYNVTAAKNGYQKARQSVSVDGDENGCAVEKTAAEMSLMPE